MAVDLKKTEMTQRTWVLLMILTVAVAAYFFLAPAESPTAPVSVAVGIPPKKNVANVAPVKEGIPAIQQPVPVGQTIRDPFQVPAAYRHPDPATWTETANTHLPAGKEEIAMNTAKPKPFPVPQLRGVVMGGNTNAAILSLGTESRAVKVGDQIGEYKLVTVEEDAAVLSGPNGLLTLSIRRSS